MNFYWEDNLEVNIKKNIINIKWYISYEENEKKIQKISIRIHVITNVDVNCLVDIQWLSSHSCISISIFAITYNEIRHLKLFHHINS